mmetsp:Transcript_22191/g.57903  ORF Transcript_22191/g.57903 Transcript_22191/m.57903 type:complete len:82 (+) Transcript_22191:1430-1675(+)|eukprot:309538-Pelagomonas_calceolata.AAC.1
MVTGQTCATALPPQKSLTLYALKHANVCVSCAAGIVGGDGEGIVVVAVGNAGGDGMDMRSCDAFFPQVPHALRLEAYSTTV